MEWEFFSMSELSFSSGGAERERPRARKSPGQAPRVFAPFASGDKGDNDAGRSRHRRMNVQALILRREKDRSFIPFLTPDLTLSRGSLRSICIPALLDFIS